MLRPVFRAPAALRAAGACRAAAAGPSPVGLSAWARAASTARFTKDHEYAFIDGKVATCGITNFAQIQLGDVVYVSIPDVGAKVKKG